MDHHRAAAKIRAPYAGLALLLPVLVCSVGCVHRPHPAQPSQAAAPSPVKDDAPPTLHCIASPPTVEPGTPVQIDCTGHSPQNRPLTYSCTSAGSKLSIETHGSSSVVTTAGVGRGHFTIRCTVTDDQDHAATSNVVIAVVTATSSSRGGSKAVVAPPSPPPPSPPPPAPAPLRAITPPPPQAEALQVFHAHRVMASALPPAAGSRSPASVPEQPAAAPPRTPSDADAAFLKWHEGLPYGHIQDNIGTFQAMRLGVPYTITVTIAGDKAAPLPTAPGTTQSALQVSNKMRVLLTNGVGQANGFTIVDADPVENPKPLAPDGSTQWNWTVTPNRLGNLQLHIAAFVLKDDSDPIGYSYESYDRNVDVKSVTLWGYLTNGLIYVLQHPAATIKYWLPGGGGAAILAALFAWWKKRKAGTKST